MEPVPRGISPLTTWHSQSGLLLISFTWGASYMVPEKHRIPFSEVFPTTLAAGLFPMWAWGYVMMSSALTAFVAERSIRRRPGRKWNWRVGWGAHMMLGGTYITLAVCALTEGVSEWWQLPHYWGLTLLTALSRPVLWTYIGYLHSTYARMPRPRSYQESPDVVA